MRGPGEGDMVRYAFERREPLQLQWEAFWKPLATAASRRSAARTGSPRCRSRARSSGRVRCTRSWRRPTATRRRTGPATSRSNAPRYRERPRVRTRPGIVSDRGGPRYGRRVLVLTYPHPPMPFLGGDPWSGLVAQLRKLGHELTIVTSGAYGGLPTDAGRGGSHARPGRPERSAACCGARRSRPTARPGCRTKPPPAILTRVIVPDPYLVSWTAWTVHRPPAGARAPNRMHDHDLAARLRPTWSGLRWGVTDPPGSPTSGTGGHSRDCGSRFQRLPASDGRLARGPRGQARGPAHRGDAAIGRGSELRFRSTPS